MEKWIVLLLFLTSFVFSDAMACVDQANVDKVNSIARELGGMASAIPPANFSDSTNRGIYKQSLHTVCTTLKPKLDELASLVGACPAIILLATDLHKIKLFGKGFLELNMNFADLNEFCKCSPHLVSAWTIAAFKHQFTISIPNGAYGNVTDVGAMCNSDFLPDAIRDLDVGQKICPKLWKEAGVSFPTLVSEMKQFIDYTCTSKVKGQLQCAINVSSKTVFVKCMKGVATVKDSNKDHFCSSSCCRQRDCVKQHVDFLCGDISRDLYIDAVNLQRPDKNYLIGPSECVQAGASTAHVSVMSALGISLFLLML